MHATHAREVGREGEYERAEQYSQRTRDGEQVARTAIRCIHRKVAEERERTLVCVCM
jgi:hypothetical protein